jgi:cytosine/uracil/thiamine/allantoin permease
LALVPTFEKVAPFGWFIGAALGAIAYFIVTRGRPLVEGPLEETVARSEQQPVD